MLLTNCIATGGPTAVVYRMAQALQERGLAVAIWGLSTPAPGVVAPPGVPVRSFEMQKGTVWWAATGRLTRELIADPPDVLHIHNYTTHVHGVRAARQAGVRKVVVSFHDFRLGRHRVANCRRLRTGLDRVIVLNETMRELYQRECWYTPKQMFVLSNAVDTQRFSPRPRDEALAVQWGVAAKDYVIGAVGGLNPNKGHRFLTRALPLVRRTLPNARLVLVGEGRDRRALGRLARRLGVEREVIFAGLQHDLPPWYSLMNLYVQPSLIESDPLAVHEAMATGLPVVSTNRGGMPELLVQGEAGVLVPPGRPEALAEAIVAVAQDPARAAALGAAGRRLSMEKYDLGEYEARLGQLYDELLREG